MTLVFHSTTHQLTILCSDHESRIMHCWCPKCKADIYLSIDETQQPRDFLQKNTIPIPVQKPLVLVPI